MKNTIFLFILLFAFVGFQTVPKKTPVIKDILNQKTKSKVSYTYTSDKKVLSQHSSDGYINTYEYDSGKSVMKKINNSSAIDTFILNKNGLAELEIGHAFDISQFEYNGNEFLIQQKTFIHGELAGIWKWAIANDNIVSNTYVNNKGILQNTILYTYYPNSSNTISNKNMGMSFWGRGSKNLIKETISLSPKGDTLARLIYKYNFDATGSVATKVTYNKSGALTDSISYFYY